MTTLPRRRLPNVYNEFKIENLNGGLNTRADPTLIADNQVAGCSNVDFDVPGVVSQRSGYERVGNLMDGAFPVAGLGTLKLQSNGNDYLISKVNGMFRYVLSSATTTWTDIGGGYSLTDSVYDVYNDKLYVFNEIDPLLEWTGSGLFTTYSSAPRGKAGVIFQNRAFVGGVNGTASRLYYSVIGSVTDFTGAGSGFIDVNRNDGFAITGLGESGGVLQVHKGDSGIYDVSFDSSSVPSVAKSEAYQGAIRHQTISRFDNASLYLSTDSIRSVGQLAYYPDSRRDQEVSLNIRPTVLSFQSTFSTNAVGIFSNNKYYLAAPVNNSSYNDVVLTYAYGAWSIYNNVYASGFVYWNGYVHFGDSRKGQVYRFNPSVKTDDGATITSTIQTKVFRISGDAVRKQILGQSATMRADQGTSISINYAPNFGDYQLGITVTPVDDSGAGLAPVGWGRAALAWGRSTSVWGGGGGSGIQKVPMDFRWSFKEHVAYVQFQFQHNSANKTYDLLSFGIIYSEDPWKDWFNLNTEVAYQ